MKEYNDVVRNILNLSEKLIDGLNHIISKLEEGYFENTLSLFGHIVEAVYRIEKITRQLSGKLQTNGLEAATANLIFALNFVVCAYEHGQRVRILTIMRKNLLPAFENWRKTLNYCFSSYVA